MKDQGRRSSRLATSAAGRTLVSLGIVLGASTLVAASPQRGEPGFGSSVILIVLDDLGTDRLGFYQPELYGGPTPACGPNASGDEKPFPCTPTLERLRGEGMLFTQAYTNPSCSPSRASILTGRYARRHGLGRVVNEGVRCGASRPCDGPESVDGDEVLLPELLRGVAESSGWDIATAAFGKYHLSYVSGDECHPIENGFELFQGNMGNSGRNLVGPDHFEWVYTVAREGADGGCELIRSSPIEPALTCPPDMRRASWDATVARKSARRWINAQLAADRRFFAYLSFNPPHRVHQVPPLCRLSPETQANLASFGLTETGQLLSCEDTSCSPARVALYNATVEAIDREIELLLTRLPEDITVIVIGDNGTPTAIVDAEPTNLPVCRTKGSVYQLGVRVPLIVSGEAIPEHRKGSTSYRVVDSVDLWKTVANIVGLTDLEIDTWLDSEVPGRVIDSSSMLPLFDNPWATSVRTYSYTERFAPNQGNGDGRFTPRRWDMMVTDGTYKLIRHLDDLVWSQGVPVSGTLREEMFKISIDPDELRPLCAPLPLDCTSECPEPVCGSWEHPDCGEPGCTDPFACCPRECAADTGSPVFSNYLELRDRLNAIAGLP